MTTLLGPVRSPAAFDGLVAPTTDLGVFLQVAVVVIAIVVGWRLLAPRPHWRLVLIGVGLLLFGAMGLRAAH